MTFQLPLEFNQSNKFPIPIDANEVMQVGKIRRAWLNGEWVYSIVDLVMWAANRDPQSAVDYWRKLRSRLSKAGSQTVSKVDALKMPANDGRLRQTDVGNAELILRVVQDIPGARTNDVKDWLAQVGAERLEEEANPDKGLQNSLSRFVDAKVRQGFTADEALKFAQLAIEGRIVRNTLTDALKACVVGSIHYGVATNTEYKTMFGKDAEQIRKETGFKNARDGMTIAGRALLTAAEDTIERVLRGRVSVTFNEALEIIKHVGAIYHISVDQAQQVLGIDLATGKALLGGGQ